MAHRPEQIETQEFTRTRRGYDRDEVRLFLRALADDVRQHQSSPPVPVDHNDESHNPGRDAAVAVIERAAEAAGAVRADARRASEAMREGADRYVAERRASAEADEIRSHGAVDRRSVEAEMLAIRTRLTEASNARLLAEAALRRASQTAAPAVPAGGAAPSEPESGTLARLRAEADGTRHRLAREQTTTARLRAEASTLDAERDEAHAAVAEAEAQIERLTARLSDATASVDTLGQQLSAARHDRDDAATDAAARSDAARLRAEAVALLAEARAESEQARLDAIALRAEIGAAAGHPSPAASSAAGRIDPSSPPVSRTAPPGLGLTVTTGEEPGDDDPLVEVVRTALDEAVAGDRDA